MLNESSKKEEKRKARSKGTKSKTEAILYKQMAHDYWDRWKWERKHDMKQAGNPRKFSLESSPEIRQIDPMYLIHPRSSDDGKPTETYLGSGSFSIVRLQIYHGIKVVVKQFRACSFKDDVAKEAKFLTGLCHPNLPYVFGVCTTDYIFL